MFLVELSIQHPKPDTSWGTPEHSKQGKIYEDVPSYFLKPIITSLEPDVEITMPVYEVIPITFALNKKQTRRERHHEISKRRFFPKGFKLAL